LKKRTKLALSLAGAAAVTGLVVSNIPAQADGTPQNWILVSNHDKGAGTPAVHILEYGFAGTVIHRTDPSSGTHYWPVDTGAVAYITVSKGGRTWRTPQSGNLPKNSTDGQNPALPTCLRVSTTGELHYTNNDQPCNTSGASQGTWNSA
jgi:hypothetical protein